MTGATNRFEAWVREEPRLLGGAGPGTIATAGADPSAGAAGTLKVMTYNIRHGRGMDMVIDLERLAGVIAASGAGVIGLNEVDIETERSGGVDQAAALGELLGMHVVYGPNLEYQGGLFGNAVLSRFPVLMARNVSLAVGERARWGLLCVEIDAGERAGEEAGGGDEPGGGGKAAARGGAARAGGEAAGVAGAAAGGRRRAVHVLATHLSLEAHERAAQLQKILGVVRELEGPVVLMGDFNIDAGSDEDPSRTFEPLLVDAWVQALALRRGAAGDTAGGIARGLASRWEASSAESRTERSLEAAGYTFPSDAPCRRIDYIFFNRHFRLAGGDAVYPLDTQASDHLPVVAGLRFA